MVRLIDWLELSKFHSTEMKGDINYRKDSPFVDDISFGLPLYQDFDQFLLGIPRLNPHLSVWEGGEPNRLSHWMSCRAPHPIIFRVFRWLCYTSPLMV